MKLQRLCKIVFSKAISALCLLFVSFADVVAGNPEELDIDALSEDILFVGLGSYCESADILRSCGVRKAAFPFDWILSTDGKKLIEIMDDDFSHFLEEAYLVPAKSSNTVLLQTFYHMEFHHEGLWHGDPDVLVQNREKLIKKYQRRVERFRQLKDYQGKVVFVRFANKYSLEPNVFYRCRENLEITDASALNLYSALKRYFPELNFYLMIVNVHGHEEIEEEKCLLDNLLMIRSNPVQPVSVKIAAYKKLFDKFY